MAGVLRREFLEAVVGAATMLARPSVAGAQAYPARPVRLVVGFAPGGVPDLVARLLGQWLSARLGEPFVVENHAGAASNLALADVARAAPDGYTLFELSVANAINVSLHPGADIEGAIAPIASIAHAAFMIVVSPTSSIKTVSALIDYAKTHLGKLNFGSSPTGTPPYLAVSLFKGMAHIDVVQVPYRNSLQAVEELLSGRLDVAISHMSAIEYVKSGKLHALAVTTAQRQATLPHIPSVAEFLPGYEATTWYGLGTAKAAPPEIIKAISTATNAALADPHNAAHLTNLGLTVDRRSPAEFEKFITDETKKWAEVIKAANIKPQ